MKNQEKEITVAKIGLIATIAAAIIGGVFTVSNTVLTNKLNSSSNEGKSDTTLIQILPPQIEKVKESPNSTVSSLDRPKEEVQIAKTKTKQYEMSGKVIDKSTKKPIAGVKLSTSDGVIGETDINGIFRINYKKKVIRLFFNADNYSEYNAYHSLPIDNLTIALIKDSPK